MELSSHKIKNFLYILSKKVFLIFQEMELFRTELSELKKQKKKATLKNLLYFGKWKFLSPSLEIFYIFSKKGFCYISVGNSNPLKTKIYYTFPKKIINKFF